MNKINKIRAAEILVEAQNNPTDTNIAAVIELLDSSISEVSVSALEWLARQKNLKYKTIYKKIIENSNKQYSEKMRKEATSALGRLRNIDIAKNLILPFLQDDNPEIILQAIRGLLVFKGDEEIDSKLKSLAKHKNEIIANLINIEYGINSYDTDTKKEHHIVNENFANKALLVDCMEYTKTIPNNTLHLTFTSPPYYNARDYSIYASYEEYIAFLSDLFKEIHRATKDGRYLVVNTSPIIIPRAGRKYASKRYPIPYDLHHELVNNGWDFVDDIIWLKPEASVKNRIGGFHQFRKPLAYKPNAVTENIMVYRKKSNRLVDWNISAYSDEVIDASKVLGEYESSNVWKIDPVYDRNHSAVFPEKLCDNVIKYYSMEGDLIFDPFAGSGTLGKSAIKLGRKVLLTEIDPTYFDILKNNLKDTGIEFLSE